MARPCKNRKVGHIPRCRSFSPKYRDKEEGKIFITVEEYETIRLIDYLGMSQIDCARKMKAGRTTVQAIYQSGRSKLSKALVEGRPFEIVGSHYLFSLKKERALESKQYVSRGDLIDMRLAVTYENGEIFQHFGQTENFKIYDIENDEIRESLIVNTEGQGHGDLGYFLKNNEVDALICGGIGNGARQLLQEAGIKLYAGVEGDADQRIKEFLEGALEYETEANCSHHVDNHHHGHGCTCNH